MSKPWQPGMGRYLRVRRQRGAAMIEFALVFPIFFFIIYSLLGYGLLFMLEQNITLAAAEGARAAIAVDPDVAGYNASVQTRARQVVLERLDWLTDSQRDMVSSNTTVQVVQDADGRNVAHVTVKYPNYATNPIIPAIRLPGFGTVPPYPANVQAEAKILL